MSDCKQTEKINKDNLDTSSLRSILNTINTLFRSNQTPATVLPPALLLVGKNFRPGMSARNLAARTIARTESDSGIPMGDVFADAPNREAQKILIESEEIVSMIQTEAKVSVAIDVGTIQVTSTGFAGPYPLVAQGGNITPGFGSGGVQ
jgi:hypothetical protein